jgi:hypothetical protein
MADPGLPSGTVTFLVTGPAGSTRLLQAHPAAGQRAHYERPAGWHDRLRLAAASVGALTRVLAG